MTFKIIIEFKIIIINFDVSIILKVTSHLKEPKENLTFLVALLCQLRSAIKSGYDSKGFRSPLGQGMSLVRKINLSILLRKKYNLAPNIQNVIK